MAVSIRLPRSLKFRMTIVVILLALVATMSVTWVALVLAEQDMKAIIGDQQYALLTSSAAQVDANLTAKKVLLASLAETMPANAGDSAAGLMDFVSLHPVVRGEFRNLIVFNLQGDLLHTQGDGAATLDTSVPLRAYLRGVLGAGKAIISPPYKSILTGAPAVIILQPVFDGDGRAIMLLGGSLDLANTSMMEHVASQKSGKTGYTFIMTTSGVLVQHPDRKRLLENVSRRPAPNSGTLKALGGFEGWTEAIGGDGIPCIYAYKRLLSTDWIIATRFPVEEAFAPMIAIRRQGMLAAAVLAAIAGLLAWLAIRIMLRPLNLLRQHIGDIRRGSAGIGVLQRGRPDEIGELSSAFHDLMAERETAQGAIRDSEALISSILERAPDAVVSCAADGAITNWNAAAERTFGWRRSEAVGRNIVELIMAPGPDGQPPASGAVGLAGLGGLGLPGLPGSPGSPAGARVRIAARHRDGRAVPIELSLASVRHGGENYATAFLHDVTERVLYEQQIAASARRLRMVADNLPVLIAYLDQECRFQFVNATFEHWFGADPAWLIGRPLVDGIGAWHHQVALPYLAQAYRGQVATYELKAMVQNAERTLETTFVPELAEDGNVVGIYALTHDTTRLKDIEERLTQLARIDPLTGIANRLMFEEILQLAVVRARRHRAPLALAYLDIDHFKSINDSQGHGAGDEVLREFAARLAANVRAADTVARIAGDEFVIVFEQVAQADEAARLAAKIVEAIRAPFTVAGAPKLVTTSIGVALHHGDDVSPADLVARADAALYQAKRRGRDGFAIAD
ncbi:MAG: diguanylate cyclase [Duganella sp.]